MNFKKLIVLLCFIMAVGLMEIHTSAEEYQIGDIITFGSYEQNNNREDGPEDLEWIVLEQENDRILVITKACIDCMPYHSRLESVTWESSSLRIWLNEEFIDTAFTEDEKSQIIAVENKNPDHTYAETDSGRATTDQVFVLSMKEANTYFTTYASRQAAPTAYAIARGAYHGENSQMGWWWLRTTSYYTDHVTYVTSGGDVSSNGREVTRQDAGIRPAMWIRISPDNNGTTIQAEMEADLNLIEGRIQSYPMTSAPAQKPASKVEFDYNWNWNGKGECAYIMGLDEEDCPIWGCRTACYEGGAQLTSVSDILLHEDRYYYCEAGKIVALDAATGAVVWENNSFGGLMPIGAVDSQGTLYLSGYFGPAFCAIDKGGNTLCRIEKMDVSDGCPKKIEAYDGYVELAYDSGYVFCIDTDGFSVKKYVRQIKDSPYVQQAERFLTLVRCYDGEELTETFEFLYNKEGQLSAVLGDGTPLYTFSYDRDGRLLERQAIYPESGAYDGEEYKYDSSGKLVTYIYHPFYRYNETFSYDFIYDSDGVMAGGTCTYSPANPEYSYVQDFSCTYVPNLKDGTTEIYRVFSEPNEDGLIRVEKFIYDSWDRIVFRADNLYDEQANYFKAEEVTELTNLEFRENRVFSYYHKLFSVERMHSSFWRPVYGQTYLNFTDTVGKIIYSIPEKYFVYMDPSAETVLETDGEGYITCMKNGDLTLEMIYNK